SGHARADEAKALRLELASAPDRIREIRVAAVDDDVAGLEEREELLDELIDGRARLHHEHDLAGTFEAGNELFDALRPLNLSSGVGREELVDFARREVENGDRIAFVVHVEDEILAHDRESDQTDIALRFRHWSSVT